MRSTTRPIAALSALTVAPVAAVLAALAALAVLVAGADVAGAHEGTGVIEVEAAHPAGTSTHFIVRVTWESDGHPAADATVTATPVASGGTALAPVELPPYDNDGRYAGSVEVTEPGTWTVRVTSREPTGTAETTTRVTASASDAPDEASGTINGTEGGFAPADDGTGASADAVADTGSSGSDNADAMPILLVVAAVVVAIGGLFSALGVVRRNRPSPPAGPGGPGGGNGDGDGAPGPSGPVDRGAGAGADGHAEANGGTETPPTGDGRVDAPAGAPRGGEPSGTGDSGPASGGPSGP